MNLIESKLDEALKVICSGGGSRIRTHGTSRYNGFQDRRLQPLGHPSIKSLHDFIYLSFAASSKGVGVNLPSEEPGVKVFSFQVLLSFIESFNHSLTHKSNRLGVIVTMKKGGSRHKHVGPGR